MLMRAPESSITQRDYSAIKTKMDSSYINNISLWSVFWRESNIDIRMEAGDQSIMAQLNSQALTTGSNSYYFNRIRPMCCGVSGFQRRTRKSTIVVPLEDADQETSDQWTKILLQLYKKEGIYEKISEGFYVGPLITGLSMLHLYLDFSADPLNGDIKVDMLPYNEFFVDPYFRASDLSDAQFVWRRTYLTHAAAASIMPEEDYEAIMRLQSEPTGMGKDGRFQYQAEAMGYAQGNRVSYDEYWYRDYRKAKYLYDERTGDLRDISYETDIDMPRFLRDNPQTRYFERDIPTVRLAIAIQDRVFFDGPNPLLIDNYPFIPLIGYYSRALPYMYQRMAGMVRSLRDPQLLFNRRIILSADLLESQVNSGWIFKENTVVSTDHLFSTGQGRIIPLKQGAQMTDLQAIVPPQIPPSFFELQEVFSKELFNCAGLSEENFGKVVDDDASGYKSVLRQRAGLLAQQPLLDRLDLSQNLLGERMMEIIRANYTPGKIQRILEGEQPTEYFYNRTFGKFHCQVQDGWNTETQIQMAFGQALQLREAGVQIPDTYMVEKATMQGKQDLIKLMEQSSKKQEQVQQMQHQMQMQELQSRADLSKARGEADRGLAYERISRVEENHALAQKQLAESNKEDELALLNKVKIIKELESINLAHLKTLIELSNTLKMSEQATVKQSEPLKPSEAAIAQGPQQQAPQGVTQ